MGWRISLYCVPNNVSLKWKDCTQEVYDRDGEVMFEELEKERMIYDTLTDVIRSDSGENRFSTKYFTNDLSIEQDMYFGTISKEQLLNIIEEVRVNHIVKWFCGRTVGPGDALGDAWKKPASLLSDEKWTAEEAMKANQGEWNIKAERWNTRWKHGGKFSYPNINLDMDNKWLVSSGWTYEYLIFDLIHILKIFDWNNNTLMCIGG